MSSRDGRIPVAALMPQLGELSQSWIYRQLVGLARYSPEVFASDHINNDIFPFEPVHFIRISRNPLLRAVRVTKRLVRGKRHGWPGGTVRAMAKVCRNRSVRLLHAHFGWVGVNALDLAKRTRLPLITSFYGSDVNAADSMPLYRRRLPELFERAVMILTLSEFLARRLEGMGCDAGKVRVLRTGISLDDFVPRAHANGGAPTHFVAVARLVECKDVLSLIRALAAFLGTGREGTLTIIGDGPMRGEIENAIRELGVADRVELAGARPFSFVREALAKADVFLHAGCVAADGSVEALGVCMLEASASGLPVVSVELGGIPEAVVAGETGFLVAPGDHEAFAERMIQLSDDAGLRGRMGTAGRAYVEGGFDSATLNVRLEDIYDEVLGKA